MCDLKRSMLYKALSRKLLKTELIEAFTIRYKLLHFTTTKKMLNAN